MTLMELDYQESVPIDGYGAGFFRIQGQVHKSALLIVPNGIVAWAGLHDIAPLIAIVSQIDVLLLGMGDNIIPLNAQFKENIIPAEPMNTPAACRTYNMLLGEGRRVGLAALPIG